MCNLYGFIFFFTIALAANAFSLVETKSDTLFMEEVNKVETETMPLNVLKKDTVFILQKKFQPNFKDKYDSSEFDYTYERQSKRGVIEQLIQKIKEFFGFVDRNSLSPKTFFNSEFFRILSVIIIALIIAYIIKLLIKNDFNRFFRKSAKPVDVEIIDIDQQIHTVDFEKLLNPTIEKRDYRLAIRYYYLWILRRLSNAEVIKWHAEKTNADYLFEIQNQTLKKDFEYLSYLYNNIWYGEFEITLEEFLKAQEAFIQMLHKYKDHE